MGSATYELKILLSLTDKATSGLHQSLAALKQYGAEAKAILQSLKQLEGFKPRSSSSGVSTQAQELRLLREETRLRQDQARLIGIESRNKAQAAQAGVRGLHDELRLMRERQQLQQGTSRAAYENQMRDMRLHRENMRLQREELALQRERRTSRSERIDNAIQTGRTVLDVGRRTYSNIQGFTDPALELMRSRTRFQLLGYSPDEQTKGLSAVKQVTSTTKGVRESDVTDLLVGLTNTMGSIDEATQMLPMGAKFLASVEALHGEGRGQAVKQFTDAMRAVELLGKDRSVAEASRYAGFIAQASIATGGEIDPREFRNFAKYGQVAAMQMTPQALGKYAPLLAQMGGQSAGTALTSLNSALAGGQLEPQKLRYWDKLGLLDRSKVEYTKQGQIKRIQPGAIPIAEGFAKDPLAFSDRLMVALQKQGVNTGDESAVAQQIEMLFGSRTAKRGIAQMMVMRESLRKETANIERAPDTEGVYGSIFGGKNPLGQYQDYQTAAVNARAQIGTQAATLGGDIAEKLAGYMQSAQIYAADNPAMATAMMGVYSLGKASAESADAVSLLGRIAGGVGSGSGSGGDSGISSVVAGGAGALGRSAWGFVANPIGLSVAGALGAVYASVKKWRTSRAQEGVEREQVTDYQSIAEKRGRGEYVDYGATASGIGARLKKGGALPASTGDTFGSRSVDVSIFEPSYLRSLLGNKPTMPERELVSRFAPQLRVPEVRQAFYQNELPKLGLSSEGQKNLKQAIEIELGTVNLTMPTGKNFFDYGTTNPISQQVTSVGDALSGITPKAQTTSNDFDILHKSVFPVPDDFTRARSAISVFTDSATSAADRLNSIGIKTGNEGGDNSGTTTGVTTGGDNGGTTKAHASFTRPLIAPLERESYLTPQVVARASGGAGTSGGIHLEPHITINGVSNPKEAADAVMTALRKEIAELRRLLNDPNHANKIMSDAYGIDEERA